MLRGLQRFLALIAIGAVPILFATPVGAQRASQRSDGSRLRGAVFVGMLTASASANTVLHYHHAAGAVRPVGDPTDLWLGRDKAYHGGGSYALTLGGIAGGVRPWVAALGVCGAGAVFEATQVRFSGKDAFINCAGAAMAWGTSKLFPRR